MIGSAGNSELCFPETILMFSLGTKPRGTLWISVGNKMEAVIKFLILSGKIRAMQTCAQLGGPMVPLVMLNKGNYAKNKLHN